MKKLMLLLVPSLLALSCSKQAPSQSENTTSTSEKGLTYNVVNNANIIMISDGSLDYLAQYAQSIGDNVTLFSFSTWATPVYTFNSNTTVWNLIEPMPDPSTIINLASPDETIDPNTGVVTQNFPDTATTTPEVSPFPSDYQTISAINSLIIQQVTQNCSNNETVIFSVSEADYQFADLVAQNSGPSLMALVGGKIVTNPSIDLVLSQYISQTNQYLNTLKSACPALNIIYVTLPTNSDFNSDSVAQQFISYQSANIGLPIFTAPASDIGDVLVTYSLPTSTTTGIQQPLTALTSDAWTLLKSMIQTNNTNTQAPVKE